MDSIFTQTRYVEAYMWGGAAAMFSDEGQIFSTSGQDVLGPLATDEAFTMFNVDGSSSYSGDAFCFGVYYPPRQFRAVREQLQEPLQDHSKMQYHFDPD